MKRGRALYLYEEIMLLALQDKKGTVASGTWHNMAAGGAVLAELLLDKRLEIEQAGKKKFAKVIKRTGVGDPLIDECLTKVVEAKRRAQLQTWVSKFANLKNLRHRVAQQLARRGILRVDEDKILGIFTRKIYPEVDPRPEREIIARLREAIFSDSQDVDPRTVVLLSLANSGEILKVVFDRKALKDRKKRIEQVVNGEMTGKATQEAIQAVQAAVMVACIMPAVMAATSAAR